MTKRLALAAVLMTAAAMVPRAALAKDKEPAGPPKPIGWAYIKDGPRDFSGKTFDLHKVNRKIAQGSLLPVFKTKEKDGETYGRVSSLNLDNGFSEDGWVKISPETMKPPDAFPLDGDLVPLLGGSYLDDVVADHTEVARFLVHQAHGPDLMLCYLLTGQLMTAKLVVFVPANGKFTVASSIDIPIAETQNGITSLETRDLVGDGNDCILSKEKFRNLADTSGTNFVIRRAVAGELQTVWQVPVKFKNLSQYNSELRILQPPLSNIGAPGTVTTGEVTYKPEGKSQTPVWNGKVEFFVINHEKALDSVSIEKACPWDGTKFAPLQ